MRGIAEQRCPCGVGISRISKSGLYVCLDDVERGCTHILLEEEMTLGLRAGILHDGTNLKLLL